MNDVTKKWIEAGRILSANKHTIVKCPVCNIGILVVKDEPIPNHDGWFDRYLICDNCANSNVLSMSK